MGLLRQGHWQLHSGGESDIKLECDSLTINDWISLAWMISTSWSFGRVYGIPEGGKPLERILKQYADPLNDRLLIVDDVMTTGASFVEAAEEASGPFAGVCVFARGDRSTHPAWVSPIFVMQQPYAEM